MNELTQALLNTCVVSDEAKTKLESIISGGGSQGLELYEIECTDINGDLFLSINFNQLCALVKNNKYPYFQYAGDNYYFWETLLDANLYRALFIALSTELMTNLYFSSSSSTNNFSTTTI